MLVCALALMLVAALVPTGAAAAPAAPGSLSPVEGTRTASNPVLSWSAVAAATAYRVQISAGAGFDSLLYNVQTDNLSATPPNELPAGTLYWRVAAIEGRTTGPFATSSFERTNDAAPVPISPGDGATLEFPVEPPTFAWQPFPRARSYRLEVSTGAGFIHADAYTTDHTSYTLTEPDTIDQTFYWRVQAILENGTATPWSATRTYETAWPSAPVLRGPPNTISPAVQDVVLRWEPVLGASTYQVQVSPNADWANNVVIDTDTVKGTRYSPPVTLDNGSYFWRVRALDAKRRDPNFGPWSAVWQFSRDWPDRPQALEPADGATVSEPTLRWSPVPHASHYELQIATDRNFSPGLTESCFTNATTFTRYVRIAADGRHGEPGLCRIGYTTTLRYTPGTTYYWRVRGIDAPRSVNGLWSNTGGADTPSFTYRPDVPELVTPLHGQAVETPVLVWNGVRGHGRYRVTIVRAAGSTITATTHALSYTPTARLNPDHGPFQWYVQTVDAAGRVGVVPPASQWGSFTLAPPDTSSAPLVPLTPHPGADLPALTTPSTRMPAMTWTPHKDADHYKVFAGRVGSGTVTSMSGTTRLYQAGYTHMGSTSELAWTPGDYIWYVEAYSSGGAHLATGPQGAFTIEPLDWTQLTSPAKCLPDSACASEGTTPTLEWLPVDHAGGYIVYVAVDPNFTNEYRRYWTTHTQLTPRESYLDNQAGQAYYWFVRPCFSGSQAPCGPFNTDDHERAYAFHKASVPVTAESPDDEGRVADLPTFTWEEYLDTNLAHARPTDQGARGYRFRVSTVQDFATVLDTRVVDQTTYTPFALTYPEGPLYWQVQALDGSENHLTWSERRLLVKDSPPVVQQSPANNAQVSGMPALAWAPQAYAAQYEVEVYRDGDLQFSPSNRVVRATTKMASFTPDRALGGGQFAWRVRRLDADGRPGPWSAGRRFTLAPSAPSLLEPADGASTRTPLFRWSAVADVASYRFEASASSSFATLVEQRTTVMNAWAPTRLWREGTYHWRVRALDARGNVLATSGARTVQIPDAGPGGPPPPDGAGTDRRLATTTDPVRAAVELSQASFLDGSAGHVLIGRDDVFADSLAGAALAGTSGPILYTTGGPTASPRSEMLSELQRVLGPATGCGLGPEVYILGGTEAISPAVQQAVEQRGYCVKRYAGASRVETAVEIAHDVLARDGRREVLVARADLWADAATGGAYAAAVGAPIVVTQQSRLHPEVDAFLRTASARHVLLGGEAALSAEVETAVRQRGRTTRVWGAARDLTAVAIAEELWAPLNPKGVVLVNGYGELGWTYALAAAVPAAREQAVQLYVQRDAVSAGTKEFLHGHRYTFVIAVGPTSVISDSVYHEVRSGADRVT